MTRHRVSGRVFLNVAAHVTLLVLAATAPRDTAAQGAEPPADDLARVMAHGLNGHGAAVVGEVVVVVGGDLAAGDHAPLRATLRYAPTTRQWREGADLPTPRVFAGVAALDGDVFVAGGVTRDAAAVATVDVYDVAADSWRTGPPLAVPRNRLSLVALDGRLYAVGGMTMRADEGDANCGVVEVYDPVTESWSRAADMPTPRHGHAAAVSRGRLYVVGGYTSSGATAVVEEYDPETNAWRSRAPMTHARGFFGAVADSDGWIHCLNGRDRGGPFAEVYDPAADSWLESEPRDAELNRYAAVFYDDQILVIGGEGAPLPGPAAPFVGAFDLVSGEWTE